MNLQLLIFSALMTLPCAHTRQSNDIFVSIPERGVFKPDCRESLPFIEATLKAQSANRDLSGYDKLGPLCVSGVPSFSGAGRVEVRNFIWEHWKQKRPAYLIATFHTIDAGTSTALFFIEPDWRGVWHVKLKFGKEAQGQRITSNPQTAEQGCHVREHTAYDIKRAPADKKLAMKALRFLDSRGQLIIAF